VSLRDKTTLDQEHLDRQLAVLHATQNDVERARSQIIDTLSGLKYQLESVQATIQSAQATFENRSTEAKEEEKALADTRNQVKTLDSENTELLAKLQSLREQFKSTYSNNVELVRTRK
jgi:chromosome segregation ATPase